MLFAALRTEGDVNRQWWRRAAKATRVLRGEGFFPEHARWTLDAFGETGMEALDWCDEGDEAEGTGMLIAGPVGTGKTSFAAAIARVFVCRGGTVKFLLARQLFREIWETYRDSSPKTESQIVAELCGVDLLVIDDLDKEGRITDATVSALHEILSKRRGFRRPTLITTNLGDGEVRALYGDSLASRILAFKSLVLRGEDRRLSWPAR